LIDFEFIFAKQYEHFVEKTGNAYGAKNMTRMVSADLQNKARGQAKGKRI
jgi:hypothetical protein